MAQLNTWSDVSAIANSIQEMAHFVVREQYQMQNLVTVFTDQTGANPRNSYEYNQATASTIAETDDLTSSAFTPSLAQTLTPAEIGEQFFVTDLRASSSLPEDVIRDGAQELGMAAGDKVEADLVGLFSSLTGGTIGAAGTVITWGYLAAAIGQARNASKSTGVQLSAVIHGYQWSVLAKSASVAGASVVNSPAYTEEITRTGYVANFMGVPIYQVYSDPDAEDDFTGGVFPKKALAIDWRRPIRIEPERDASRRGTEFNMSAVYAKGVWRPALGIQMTFDASAPTS